MTRIVLPIIAIYLALILLASVARTVFWIMLAVAVVALAVAVIMRLVGARKSH